MNWVIVIVGLGCLVIGVFIGPVVRSAIAKEVSGLKAKFEADLEAIQADAAGKVTAVARELGDVNAKLAAVQKERDALAAKVISLIVPEQPQTDPARNFIAPPV